MSKTVAQAPDYKRFFKTLRCMFLVENLDLEAATGVQGARWEAFQIAHLNDNALMRIENKSRQIAYSWLAAAEAVADGILEERTSVFVSINQEEAMEKVRYARQIIQALPPQLQPRLRRDNEMLLELQNGTRIVSLPAKPPRGKSRVNIYLDEFAHVGNDREIYMSALPVLSKGGRLRIGSSPRGAQGVFWEIFTEKLRPYPGYTRRLSPWWEAKAFCNDVKAARKDAPSLSPASAVYKYGNERIVLIFENMMLDDFEQEYCGTFVDEAVAWITWEEIQANQSDRLFPFVAKSVDAAYLVVDRIRDLIRTGKCEQVLSFGVDIGRKHDTTEIYGVGLADDGRYPLRVQISLDRASFDDQFRILDAIVGGLPVMGLQIDETGIGANLAERLMQAYPGKVLPVSFTMQLKQLWASDVKMLMQQQKTPIPIDRDLAYQIHSIRRVITPAKNLVFDVAANEKHHADKYYAWTLALTATRAPMIMPLSGDLLRAFAWQ